MKCPHCGHDVRQDARFCRSCGKLVREMRIGSYHVVDRWHNRPSIYWVESIKPAPQTAGARHLAIRLPRPLSNDQLKRMCALTGPYLARVLGQAGDAQKHQYLIVDSIDGTPLDTLKGKMDTSRATKVFEKILRGMIYLHDQGWVVRQQQRQRDDDLMSRFVGWLGLGSVAGEISAAENDPATRFQQAFAIDANETPVMFDYTIWEQAPVLPAEREECVKQDMRLTVGMLHWLMTSGRLTKELEKVRQASGQIEQFIINVLQEAYPTFRELGEAFFQMKPSSDPGKTAPLPAMAPAALTQRLPISKITSAAMTDNGVTREHNEDNYLAQPLDAAGGIFVVADGMGGHAAGEVASKMAIEEIYKNAVAQWATVQNTPAPDKVREILGAWIKNANTTILAEAQRRGNNMGTTVTAALVVNGVMYAANVGDSRTYLFRSGQLYPLTRDHSLVASLVQAGILKPEEVYTHPQRNEVFRALGQQRDVNVDVFGPNPLGNEDRLVLCSDGLWEMVRQPQFEHILRKNPDPQTACAELIKTANANGGEDNISVVIIRVTFE